MGSLTSWNEASKLVYDRSAKDLPELNIGQPIRMKLLPDDRMGRWRRGVCLWQVGPRSYLINVEGTTYLCNRVDLLPVVPLWPSAHAEWPPEQPGDTGAAEGGLVSGDSAEEVISSPVRSSRSLASRSPPSSPQAAAMP